MSYSDYAAGRLARVQRAEPIARAFHESYERQASSHGYETRPESAVPWADVPENNKALMLAVVNDLLDHKVVYEPSDTGRTGGLTPDEKMVNVWAKALVCELHDRDYWPNEAQLLAGALDRLGMLPIRVHDRIRRTSDAPPEDGSDDA